MSKRVHSCVLVVYSLDLCITPLKVRAACIALGENIHFDQ